MGKRSRDKGHDFERLIAGHYRERWPAATVRRSLQAHRPYEPDVVVEGNAPAVASRLWTECCHSKHKTYTSKYEQAIRDVEKARATGKIMYAIPVVAFKRQGEVGMRAALSIADLLYLLGVTEMGEPVRCGDHLVQLPFASFLAILPDGPGEG